MTQSCDSATEVADEFNYGLNRVYVDSENVVPLLIRNFVNGAVDARSRSKTPPVLCRFAACLGDTCWCVWHEIFNCLWQCGLYDQMSQPILKALSHSALRPIIALGQVITDWDLRLTTVWHRGFDGLVAVDRNAEVGPMKSAFYYYYINLWNVR